MATGPIDVSVRTDEDRAKTDPVAVVRDFLRVADAAEVFGRCKAVLAAMARWWCAYG
jgi:hypothetical protein